MKLTIVIPAYNADRFLEKCVLSCINQKGTITQIELELIIVNDGSCDNTLLIAESFVKKYDFIRVVSQLNKGLSEARNTGIKNATGDFIWFVDADDWIDEKSLSILMPLFDNSPDIIQIGAEYTERKIRLNVNDTYSEIGQKVLVDKDWSPCAPLYLFKRSFLSDNTLRFYPNIYHEDNEFTPRALYLAKKVIGLSETLYYIYESDNSIIRSKNEKKAYDGIIVVQSLYKFINIHKIEGSIYRSFCLSMSEVINNALSDISCFDDSHFKRFNKELGSHSNLLDCLKYGRWYHKLEYFLFKLFPMRYVEIYLYLHRK